MLNIWEQTYIWNGDAFDWLCIAACAVMLLAFVVIVIKTERGE